MSEEFTELLDRKGALENAQPLIDAACPLLRDVVNHATHAFARVLRAADDDRRGGENEDLAAYILYRHVIELSDGAEVLFAHSAVDASIPIVRAAFEASISLDFILQNRSTYAQRSLCWLVGYIQNRLRAYDQLDGTTRRGQQYREALEKEFTESADDIFAFDAASHGGRLQTVLDQPALRPIEADYQVRLKRRQQTDWFALMEGPTNRRELARLVGREAEYLSFYSEWSGFSHATDASKYIRPGRVPGEVAFLALRTPHPMPHRAFTMVRFVIRATRLMIDHFRPGEPNLDTWYNREVRERWHALRRLEVTTPDDAEV